MHGWTRISGLTQYFILIPRGRKCKLSKRTSISLQPYVPSILRYTRSHFLSRLQCCSDPNGTNIQMFLGSVCKGNTARRLLRILTRVFDDLFHHEVGHRMNDACMQCTPFLIYQFATAENTAAPFSRFRKGFLKFPFAFSKQWNCRKMHF